MVNPRSEHKANPVDQLMTKAAKFRRRFKAGRPKFIPAESMNVLAALSRTFAEMDKANTLMTEEGLDRRDLRAYLVYRKRGNVEIAAIPSPDRIGPFIEEIAKAQQPTFLGLLFYQKDRDAIQGRQNVTWVIQFMGDPSAERDLRAARMKYEKDGHPTLGN